MPIRFFDGGGGNIVGYYGTFTPVLRAGGSDMATYVKQLGSYYRIGRVINFTVNIQIQGKSAYPGSVTITGLPDYAETRDYVNMISAYGISVNAGDRPKAVITGGDNFISLYKISIDGVQEALTATNIALNANFTITGAYLTGI